MDTSKRTSTDQATNVQQEQALRRLKYLHTSLASPSKPKGSNLKPIQTTSSHPLSELKDDDNGEDLNQRLFLALSPDSNFKPVSRGGRHNSRQRIGFRPVCKGRVPLKNPQNYFNPTFRPLSTKRRTTPWDQRKRETPSTSRKNIDTHSKERTAKSAPASGGLSSLNPEEFDCIQCFANEVQRLHEHEQKNETTEYSNGVNNDIKINRVTFSARPRPKITDASKRRVTKIVSEKTLDVPQTLYGGWGVRSRRRIKPEVARRIPRESRKDLDLTADFQTLRITPCGSEEGGSRNSDYNQYPPPAAPPTPVRQIDIKMPEGHLVQYRLQTVP